MTRFSHLQILKMERERTRVPDLLPCPQCEGTGIDGQDDDDIDMACEQCHGTGSVYEDEIWEEYDDMDQRYDEWKDNRA